MTLCLVMAAVVALAQAQPATGFADLQRRADEAYRAQRFDESARLYRDAVKMRPTWAEGWGYLASSLTRLQRYAEARDAYRQTTVLTPANGPSWAFLGLCEYELKDYRQSFAHLRKSMLLGLGDDPQLTGAVKYHLAILWDTAGQFPAAMKEIAWFADKNIDTPSVIEASGLIALRLPDFPYEIPASEHDVIMKAGRAAWTANAHHLDEARKLYQELVTEFPKQPNLHYAFGAFLVQLDQQAALKQYDEEIAVSPAHAPAHIEAAYLCLVMGQIDTGLAYARKAVELQPNNAAAHNIRGRILMEKGDVAAATQELAAATRLAPADATFHLHLAQAYQRAGNKTLAAREFAAFDRLNKQQAQAQGKPALP